MVDQTGLSGRFDFTLKFTPDQTQLPPGVRLPPPPDDAAAPPDLFTAVEEPLGLKLQPTKAQIDVIAIDRVAKPSRN